MKKIFLALLVSAIFASCSQRSFKINGEVSGKTIPSKVYLRLIDGVNEPKTVDSTEIKDGKFFFKGDVAKGEFAVLSLSNDTDFPLILEKGEINFKVDLDNISEFKVTGTPSNKILGEFMVADKQFRFRMDSVYQSYINAQMSGNLTDELGEKIKKDYEAIDAQRSAFVEKSIKDNSKSFAAAVILMREQNSIPEETFFSLFAGLGKDLDETAIVKSMQAELNKKKATAIGQPFADFKLPDVDGKETQFSALVGSHSLVLIDFWASWCGPCRRENPNVVKLYEKYKAKNFQIVGVSLDNSKDKWLEAIKVDGITWPQLSDLKGWKSSAANLYGVKAIPATVLIKDGIIIAKDLRGEELESKVAELLR